MQFQAAYGSRNAPVTIEITAATQALAMEQANGLASNDAPLVALVLLGSTD